MPSRVQAICLPLECPFLRCTSVDVPVLLPSLIRFLLPPLLVFPGGWCRGAASKGAEVPRAGTGMCQPGPTLTPGCLWPGPGRGWGCGSWIWGSQGPRRSENNIPLKSGRGDGILLERYLQSRRTSHTCMLSRSRLFATTWTVSRQAPLSMGFSRQEYCSGLPCPPPGDLPDSGIEPTSLISPALAGRSLPLVPPWEALKDFKGCLVFW